MTVLLVIAAIGIFLSLLVAHLAYQLADRWQERRKPDDRLLKDIHYARVLNGK